ncbi:unnamed protein product [Tetraodon nigroviridis]|uniref:(spotted green pufferfish) hypothetical protein n=1 Tax=Tetraodon nigroviridis TaxID=99883 RepID=Q4SPZ1_TETNG|nr:unnamed protein product [Tetraodon nigroviridis]
MCARAGFFCGGEAAGGRRQSGRSSRREKNGVAELHPSSGDMRRREKRLLQVAGLLLAALLFLPNVGLWSLYRDRAFYNSPNTDGPGGTLPLQMRRVVQVGADGVRRVDWHDYEAIRKDAARTGNGEQGKAFPLTDSDRVDQAYRENGFNIYISDRISLNRSLPDIRHSNCKQKLYAEKLPNTSVIIPFHNEGWSSLLRTVHSVLNRSPPQLIAEIILVDDFSDKAHLGCCWGRTVAFESLITSNSERGCEMTPACTMP